LIPLDWVGIECHSEVERFARGDWAGAYDGKNFMIALSGYTAFFDRSADDGFVAEGGTVVAGFVSTIEQWALWEKEWKDVLRRFRVPYFHMKEFAPSKKVFSGTEWADNNYRRDFVAALVGTLKRWAMISVADYMEHQIYRDAKKLTEVEKTFNPFVECGRNCALQVKNFIRNELRSGLPISYVFEQGDEGKGMLIDMMLRSELPSPSFKRPRPDPEHPHLDRDDPPMIQLQAADLLAWEIRRWKTDYRNGAKMRQSLKSFCGLENNIWKECTYTDMASVILSAKIPRKEKP